MTDLDAHQRRGAHRARGNPWRAVLPSLLAVASVVSLIVALTVWRGQAGDGAPAAFAGRTSTSATNDAVSAPATTPPSATSSTAGQSSASGSGPATSTAAPSIGVVVLNGSGRSGLGARVAKDLRAAGWDVTAIGNFRGSVPSTTIYFPSGHADDANALAAVLPGPDRIRPRFGNLSNRRLTVVLTASFPG